MPTPFACPSASSLGLPCRTLLLAMATVQLTACGPGTPSEECEPACAADEYCNDSLECVAHACGDGIVQQGVEECDEGAADTAGCDFAGGSGAEACTLAACGDGHENAAAGEGCDDGNASNEDACPDAAGGSCQPASCGDGFVWNTGGGTESCDDGAADSSTCDYAGGTGSEACTAASCGDGYVNAAAGETCEDGNGTNEDACPDGAGGTCQAAACGDGFVWNTDGGTEACDDGPADSATCDHDGGGAQGCTLRECGDWYVNTAAGESCDDGNTTPADGCADTCAAEPDRAPYAVLNTNAATDSGNDQGATIAGDGAGTWVAIWRSDDDLGGTVGTDTDLFVSRSTNGGQSWSPPQVLTSAMASDSDGDFDARLVKAAGDAWVVAWRILTASGMQVVSSRSVDGGVSWSDPVRVDDPAGAASPLRPRLAVDGSGGVYLVWSTTDDLGGTIGSDLDLFFRRSLDGGLTWVDESVVNSNASADTGDEFVADIAWAGGQTLVAAWHSTDSLLDTIGSDSDVLVSTSLDGGLTWSEVRALNTTAATDTGADVDVRIEADTAGNLLAMWRSTEDLGGTVGTDVDMFLSQSFDAGATWTPPRAINADADDPCECTQHGGNPELLYGGAGTWFAFWRHEDTAAVADAVYTLSVDGGLTWSSEVRMSPRDLVDNFTSGPYAATDGNGGWVVAWASYDDLAGTIGVDQDLLFTAWSYP